MAKEIFKQVEGFERYMVSNTGRVITTKGKVKELKPQKDAVGYFHVRLYPEDRRYGTYGPGRGKKPKLFKLHRLVLQTFFPEGETVDRSECNHKDGNKKNNCIENLEWVTREENMQHSYRTGLHKGAAYKAAMKRRRPCYAKMPDGSIVYYESRTHAAVDLETTPFTVIRSIQNNHVITRYACKGIQFFDIDELPPGETFKKILHVERLLIEFNNRYYPNRKKYMKEWNKKRKLLKKLKS